MSETKTAYRVTGIDLELDGTRYPEGATVELGEVPAGLARWLEPLEQPAATRRRATTGDDK